ncbi:MAG: M48 family metalloprotease [Bauldia sp.]
MHALFPFFPKPAARLLAIAAAAMLVAGCTTAAMPSGSPDVSAASPAAVRPSGLAANDQHARIVNTYGGVYRDPELERTLARIVGRLVAASPDPTRSYAITILNAPAVNAFALPDGYLYVTRGLLTLATDSSEVAAVIAHEMAHVTADHAAQRQNQALTAAIVNNVVTDAAGDTPAQIAVATSQRTLAGFSQQQELEADQIGIRTIAAAGYDPYAASRFLQAMGRYDAYRASIGLDDVQAPDFLASHPSNPSRVGLAVSTAQQVGQPGAGETDRDRYLAGIDGTVFGDDSAEGFIRGRNFYHPDLGIGFAVPDGFVLDNTQSAVLAMGADGTALRFDSVTLSGRETLNAYLTSGWVNGLDQSSIRATTIGGMPAVTASAAAGGWQFRIAIIELGGEAYRFIFANSQVTPAFEQAAQVISGSFRRLSPQEAAGIGPLRLRVITAPAGSTAASLAQSMRGVDNPVELFLVLNGFDAGTPIPAGSRVKIITDQ